MRPRLAPPRPAGPCRLRRTDGAWEAVAADGALVARAPTRAAVLRILRKQGGRAEAGEARRPASAVAMGTAFQRKVWAGLMRLPPGTTLTYGELARRLRCGSPRAVGRAAGANPLMGLIPCHRLVAADGPGGFAWGSAAKRRLARAERRDG